MGTAILMTVTDHFQLDRLGLVISPDFSVPNGGWRSREAPIIIEPPVGDSFHTIGQFHLSHFNIRDPEVSIDRRWRVTLHLPHATKDQVPVGSVVIAPDEICHLLNPPLPA